MSDWGLLPGDSIRRVELHDRYGGLREGGISPSGSTDNIFVFADPESGPEHGHVDRWDGSILHYSGTGQVGDQQPTGVNASLLNHRPDGRAVRVFEGSSGDITYVGEFEVDPTHPFDADDAISPRDGRLRKVIVFRLRPVGDYQFQLRLGFEDTGQTGRTVTIVPVTEKNTERWLVKPGQKPTKAEVRQQALLDRFKQHLEDLGDQVSRHRYTIEHQVHPLFNDLYNESRNQLIEVKGGVSRDEIRMAIGQLLDYATLEKDSPALAVLLPEPPTDDIADLLLRLGIAVITPTTDAFIDTADGMFTSARATERS